MTKTATYRSTSDTSGTSGASDSSFTLDRREPVSHTKRNSIDKIPFQQSKGWLLFLPWLRWVQMGREDRWDQSNPEERARLPVIVVRWDSSPFLGCTIIYHWDQGLILNSLYYRPFRELPRVLSVHCPPVGKRRKLHVKQKTKLQRSLLVAFAFIKCALEIEKYCKFSN